MTKREPLRIRLSKTKTILEIEALIQEIKIDPDSKLGAVGIDVYNKKAMKKLNEMTWAIYFLTKKRKRKRK